MTRAQALEKWFKEICDIYKVVFEGVGKIRSIRGFLDGVIEIFNLIKSVVIEVEEACVVQDLIMKQDKFKWAKTIVMSVIKVGWPLSWVINPIIDSLIILTVYVLNRWVFRSHSWFDEDMKPIVMTEVMPFSRLK